MFIGILFITHSGSAQSYKTGIGPRFGGLTSGLTVKQFNSTTSAPQEGAGHKRFILAGYEEHHPVDRPRMAAFYYGDGVNTDFFRDGDSYYYNDHRLYTTSTVTGINEKPVMGYTFKDTRADTGQDFKPFIDFFNGRTVYFDGG
jgi:hypothetical protein